MMYIEMSRDETHGGGTWAFTNCVWAPTQKRNNSGSWPFWSKILDVQEGDVIVHLRGKQPYANFVGYSIASGSGFETRKRPPHPGEWEYSDAFYRADLAEFTPFHQPIDLDDVFELRQESLEHYFEKNGEREREKLNIFYVKQSGRLQCLNGAYFSDLDEELFEILFGPDSETPESFPAKDSRRVTSVETASQLAIVKARVGQTKFSRQVKELYGNRCCFPGCGISDSRFLVGAHIARWSDNEQLRGELSNGLSLCLVHDKAFEIGLFTLNDDYRIIVNPRERESDSRIVEELLLQQGSQISLAEVAPKQEALLEHWIRVGIDPWE